MAHDNIDNPATLAQELLAIQDGSIPEALYMAEDIADEKLRAEVILIIESSKGETDEDDYIDDIAKQERRAEQAFEDFLYGTTD